MKKKSLKEAIEEQLQKQKKFGVQILEAKVFTNKYNSKL